MAKTLRLECAVYPARIKPDFMSILSWNPNLIRKSCPTYNSVMHAVHVSTTDVAFAMQIIYSLAEIKRDRGCSSTRTNEIVIPLKTETTSGTEV